MWNEIGIITFMMLFIVGFLKIDSYFYNYRKQRSLSSALPSPLVDYILKNASPQLQYKIFTKSKKLGKIIQFHRGSGIDKVQITSNYYSVKNGIYLSRTNEFAKFTPEYFIQKIKKIAIKNQINIRNERNEFLSLSIVKAIISKIQILNLKFVWFYEIELDEEIMKNFLIPSIKDFFIQRCRILNNFDIPLNAFEFLTSVNRIEVSWQRNVTSMESLMEIERTTKFSECSITRITEAIDEETIQKFIDKFMVHGGLLSMEFLRFN